MSLTFIPSLQHMAAVKVALAIYNDDIVNFLKVTEVLHAAIMLDGTCITVSMYLSSKQEAWIRKTEKKARKKLTTLLPKLIQNQVIYIFQPIVAEILFWVEDHFFLISHFEKSQYINSLCWKQEGTIDRIKTAKRFIRNESTDRTVRFLMACIYFLENDVRHLWQTMKNAEKHSIARMEPNLSVQFWLKRLQENDGYTWTQFATEYMEYNPQQPVTDPGYKEENNRIRLSAFFPELKGLKKFFLQSLWPQDTHIDDLRLCYDLLDETERREIFHSRSLTSEVLCCYLDWPLQSIFLDAVNQEKSHLTATCYEYLLRYIMTSKLMRGMLDFDYQQLLKDLWDQVPDADKEEIEKKRFCTLVHIALSYNEKKQRLPIQAVLQRSAIEFPGAQDLKKLRSVF